ncbi:MULTISPECIES: flagellar protein FlaG [unclassified Sulfurospirillum]|uniref:flagellar protein FlaG n=1 Tax=unclassified Sulfurospirillum TaxID=2618290 RepID=UPI0005007AEB|nr:MULTISPECIES: flagellar protein FlaG [unclassified Sulfurospirillum]KFL35359.1 flagellar protein FlaG [Sulfurospirillum sp. SCADC]
MDIFSTTSKQAETATTPKVATTPQVNEIKQSSDANLKNQQNQRNQDETTAILEQTVNELNDQMDLLETNIAFGFNKELSRMYVSVIEKSSGDTIRQIPTEEAMALSVKMKEIVGMIFDKKG